MMRSLYAGVAGLKTHQTRMDVIGNNIANVNTTAYKSQSMTFSDLMYQTTQAASGANATTGVGGINARQIGLGSKTSAIKTAITQQGATQTTNDPFDIMITGESFFVVNNGSENFFTRDGSFYVDGAGNLAMTSTGYNVMGWLPDTEDPTTIKQDTVTALRVMTEANMTYPAEATSQATFAGIIDTNDTNVTSTEGRVVNLEVYDNKGFKYTVRCSLHDASTADDGVFFLQIDDILDTNGKSVVKTGTGNITDYVKFGANTKGPTADTTAYLRYSTKDGSFLNVGAADGTTQQNTIVFDFNQDNLPSFDDITADFSATSNQNNNGSSTFVGSKGDTKGNGSGRKVGEMSGIAIQKDGKIYASYDNGQKRLLGQIAVANFANASGLSKEGDNLYSATQNSGDFNGVGEDITANGGYMNSGVLEMSNVDLSAEFTEMITTQRGFQANSRIITVSDTLLEELTNLKR
ncbi:MAG: flagellar hook-basal body complex protein [Lachnospiraceae bacterium]|nr:flagellar hook-basal body complex protein [Lachnospiraceae bacterium]